MKKFLFLLCATVAIGMAANAQRKPTKVIDNKGTIKWVLDSTSKFIDTAYNGITKLNDSTIILGGDLTQNTTLNINGFKLQLANLISGIGTDSLVVADPVSGELKRISASRLLNNLTAKNGLYKSADSIKLGGALTEATTISASTTNNLTLASSGLGSIKFTGLSAGSSEDSILVVDPITNDLKYISKRAIINANNGLTMVGDSVQLGGALTKPTTITTDATNVLKIDGLQSGNLATDSLVVASADGTLKKVTAESLLQSGDDNFTATNGQSVYTVTGMPAAASKVSVYRNGAKLLVAVDYTASAGTLTLTPGMAALVVAGDIIEVQWVK